MFWLRNKKKKFHYALLTKVMFDYTSKRPEITVYYSIWQIRLGILYETLSKLLLITLNSNTGGHQRNYREIAST